MSAKADRARVRGYELREAEAWRERGWLAQEAWKKAQFIGKGKLVTKPKDFFDAFDLIAVLPTWGWVAFVQVTESPFVQARSGHADRNAEHGEPPFAFTGTPDSVDEWMKGPGEEEACAEVGTVIVSYADARKPERRWWYRK